jgi:putative hemolysin
LWELIIVGALILLNGFFAMAEMAVVSARRGRLQQMAERGSKRAKAALALNDDTPRLLSTVQIGITLIGVLAGAFSGATIAEKLERALLEIRSSSSWSASPT